jgi:hypothetical protein
MPFHPAFYFAPPVYYDGVVYPGGFAWGHFLIGAIVFIFLLWLFGMIFFGRRGVRYTSY